MKHFFALVFLLFTAFGGFAQNTSVREYSREFKTYPFSDPDPVARTGRIYPYFKFEGYSHNGSNKQWKVIELENQFIKVMILPEIGGKIWTAIDKTTGREFIYNNHVVKFRNIAMRGPWTSGGIEANYGIVGHTPNVATPVDYLVRQNADGSASVFIGALDLLTRTNWSIEVNLPRDVAYFTTRSFWSNPTNNMQPYYTWMNAGIKARGNLEFVYPGNKFIGHGGEVGEWDYNSKEKKKISFYENNNFAGYKSYHVFGRYTEFFGAFWHDDNFGMARVSPHDEKPGKKLWIWGLSDQGMIWEKLLTDSDGQYVEVQSGRLFNQTGCESMFTPFKYRGFTPHDSETWKEYWFPVKGTEGFVAANDYGAINIKPTPDGLELGISPARKISDELTVKYDGRNVLSEKLNLNPLETYKRNISGSFEPQKLSILLDGKVIYEGDQTKLDLARPVEAPKDFNQNSAYGLYQQAVSLTHDRAYKEAVEMTEKSLLADSNFIPALTLAAELEIRRMNYSKAFEYAKKALSIDTYDGGANFYYGVAANKLGKIYDAKDGFDIASASVEFRSAAFTELAKIYFREGEIVRAASYAKKAQNSNSQDIEALQILAITARTKAERESYLHSLETIDPLSHFPRAFRYALNPTSANKTALVSNVRNEMPAETFLETAVWFDDLTLKQQAMQILSVAPQNSTVAYWRAYLASQSGNLNEELITADKTSPLGVFPFRPESVKVFEWAQKNTNNWKPKYLLSLIYAGINRIDDARNLLNSLGNTVEFAPLYAFRAELLPANAEADLAKAAALDPNQWRYGRELILYYFAHNKNARALEIANQYAARFPENYMIGMLRARALLLNGKFAESLEVTRALNILPYEGATDGRKLYREANLQLAIEALKNADTDTALKYIADSRIWLENLGVGKPYDEVIDSRIEDFLAAKAYDLAGKNSEKGVAFRKVLNKAPVVNSFGNYITLLSAQTNDEAKKANSELEKLSRENPTDAVTKWAVECFKNGYSTPPELLGADDDRRLIVAIMSITPDK
ncbi:MAG: DUF5107 domain-containing protein [Pyrinomonadaceae bacterium]